MKTQLSVLNCDSDALRHQVADLTVERLAHDTQREDGIVTTHIVKRSDVFDYEVTLQAFYRWERAGKPERSDAAMKAEWDLAREKLLEQPLGWIRLINGKTFIAVDDVWVVPYGNEVYHETWVALFRFAVAQMRLMENCGALIVPWISKSAEYRLRQYVCSIKATECGTIHFIPHASPKQL
ncbi:hypothetical protein KJ652_02590 [Patescibacteria group bacterium]|nr:hypothetical protein [Patescibacteria group bacterium]MBU1123454.1 hypothetical protein [Patescibacteria group bacterium]MBU1911585.1 hypothetical protein [Patescibacteria group bacterium]